LRSRPPRLRLRRPHGYRAGGFSAGAAEDENPTAASRSPSSAGQCRQVDLINRLIGDERLITSEVAGTTRDSILVPFQRDGRDFTLIDTAGVRRRARIEDEVGNPSVSKTLQAIAEAHVVTMVVDAQDSIGEQDASVLGLALSRGRALILAVNKWDNIAPEQRDEIRRLLTLKIDFVPFAPLHFVSARHGTGVGDLVASMIRAYEAAMRQMKTPELTRCIAGGDGPAPAAHRARPAHPPALCAPGRSQSAAYRGHGSQAAHVPESYKRYLANVFASGFDLFADTGFREFRSDVNPYVGDKPRKSAVSRPPNKERRDRAA
jgi:GTP-binding protein